MKINLPFFCGAIFFLSSIMPVSAGSYSDDHNDGSLSGWTSKGNRGWSESGGYAIPNGQTHSKGFLINNSPCASNGTFTYTVKGNGDQNSLDGGVVFRFTDTTHYYFVSIVEANANGWSTDNQLRLKKNSTEARSGYVTIQDSLDFTGLKSVYTIKILLRGSTFAFWLNGDSLGQYIDTANPSGSVGYAYDDLFDPYVGFDASSWADDINQYTWDISTTSGIQAGSGIWGIDNYWTPGGDNGTSLFAWPGKGNGAAFAGTDGNYTITVNGIQAIDSIAFLSTGYTISGGTINFGTDNGMYIAANKNAVIGSTINGSAGLSKYGSGALIVTGANTYTGTTAVAAGTFLVNGSLAAGSAVTVSPNATLGGTGVCSGPVTVSGGSIAPGNSGPGKLSTGSLVLDSASMLNFDLGGKSDTLIVSGALTLDGTVNFSAAAGFSTGVYRLIAYSGTLTDNGLRIGSWPAGYNCNLVSGNGYVDAAISRRLIQAEPKDTVTFTGRSASFTVSAQGTETLFYKWLRYPSDSVGNAATLSIASVTLADTNARFRCVVRDTFGADSSRWALLTVLDKPRIITQPFDQVAQIGESIRFTVTAAGNTPLSYAWKKTDSDIIFSSTASLTISSAAFSDSGNYYCIVSNPDGNANSNIAHLSVVAGKSFAAFSFAPKSGQVPLSVAFTDASTGAISLRVWRFGDGAVSTEVNPIHIYTKDSVYTVTLIVAGQSGMDSLVKRDSVFAYTEGSNPIRMIARFLSGSDVEVTLIGITAVDTLPPPPQCDSLGIWIKPKGLPGSSSDGSLIVRYRLSAFTGGQLVDTLTLPATDSLYGLMSGLYWHDGSVSKFLTVNGCMVFLRDTFPIEPPLRQGVSYFDSGAVKDTVFAFNRHILLWKDSSYTDKTLITDTLERLTYTLSPPGMIVAGTPFLFKHGNPLLPFSIGIRIDSLPAGRSLSDVRLYRDSAGSYSVSHESTVDFVHRIVSVKTADLRWPFIAMIDTVAPKITIYSDTASAVYSTAGIIDSLRIDDNIVNVRWKYFYGSGDKVPKLRAEKELRSSGSAFSLVIPDSLHVVSPESGLRALLLMSDGVHNDTINLSRSVFRYKSDPMIARENIWSPISPTAVLKNKDAAGLIAQLAKQYKLTGYDRRYMRLYRWFGFSENEKEADKWIEYDPDRPLIRSLFTLEPGRIIWLKTQYIVSLHLDTAYTLSLKDTLTVDLPSEQWTDFGMPFRFGVRIKEILSASGIDADSVLFYRWERDSLTALFFLEPLYVPAMPDKADTSKVIESLPGSGYSMFNRSSKTVRLRIPPTLAAMGNVLRKTAAKGALSWSTKFVAQSGTGTKLPSVYFGYSPGGKRSAFPLTPSFATLHLSIFDRATALRYGHHIGEDAKNGLIRELLISNNGDSAQMIRYHLENAGAFPDNYTAFCFDAAENKFATNGTIVITPKSTVSRWIIIGDARFTKNFVDKVMSLTFSLQSLYPNPARSGVNIRYTVPFGAKERLRITIYNVLGKKVWEKRMDGPLIEGSHVVPWNSGNSRQCPAGAGLYIVRLTVIDEQGKPVRQFEKLATLLR